MRPIIGRLLAIVAVVHIAVVAVFYDDAVSTILDDGVFDAVPDASGDADTAFWYLIAGFVLFVAAWLVHHVERVGGRPLATAGWSFVALGAVGQIAKPTSPFVVFVVIGALAVLRSRSIPPRRPIAGWLLAAIAVVHTVAVVSFYATGLGDIVGDGGFDAAADSPAIPDAAFWYVFSGAGMLILAGLIAWAERNERRLLPPVAWSLVAIAGVGVLVKPTSGFWVVLAVAVAAVVIARRPRSGCPESEVERDRVTSSSRSRQTVGTTS